MKKTYTKPLITVEVMMLDQPIAINCTADSADIKDLMEFGYFAAEYECEMYIGVNGEIDWDKDGVPDDQHDTVCYHSNVQTAFLS